MAQAATRRNSDTREQLLQVAERAVLEKGFAATSIDELIAEVGITKSGFFYHFKDKSALAKALLQRYLDQEDALLDDLFSRADALHDDPLHAFLISLKMLEEVMADLPSFHPGCMVAAVCYQDQLFNQEIRDLNRAGVLGWQRRFRQRLDDIATRYPPMIDIDLDDLADMISTIVDGGITISRVTRNKDVLPRQVGLFRRFVRTIFQGTGAPSPSPFSPPSL